MEDLRLNKAEFFSVKSNALRSRQPTELDDITGNFLWGWVNINYQWTTIPRLHWQFLKSKNSKSLEIAALFCLLLKAYNIQQNFIKITIQSQDGGSYKLIAFMLLEATTIFFTVAYAVRLQNIKRDLWEVIWIVSHAQWINFHVLLSKLIRYLIIHYCIKGLGIHLSLWTFNSEISLSK